MPKHRTFGGHIMAMDGSTMNVAGVELTRMGQHLTLARYPIHWHINGDVTGQYIKNSAIHDTFNRCVTIHATDNLLVENNVTYNTVGHCFFMEDGIESGNRLVRNLGIQTKCHPTLPCVPTILAAAGEPSAGTKNGQASEDVLLPSDNTASTYWITNPDNIYIDNVAAGSDSNGFWMSLPEHPNGAMGHGDQPEIPGRVERHSASSGATSPTPTSTASCSTATSGPMAHSVLPAARICPRKIPLTRTANAGIGLRGFDRLQEPQWRHLGPR